MTESEKGVIEKVFKNIRSMLAKEVNGGKLKASELRIRNPKLYQECIAQITGDKMGMGSGTGRVSTNRKRIS